MIRFTLALLVAASLQDPAPAAWQQRLEKAAQDAKVFAARKDAVRRQILVAAGLYPEFERPPLKPQVFGKVDGEGYTVERVDLETLPGFHLSGSLYRPKDKAGPFPAVVSPHGHWKEGRFTQQKDGNLPARGITFARLGFVCFMYDMVGFGDFKQLPHKFDDPAWGQGLFGVQTWNSLRAVDFVASLSDVDPKRIGCTGASGGGTQTFILTAIDDRIACAAPVNMVAAEFQGGCTCENAPFLRIGLNNVEIAAMTAPRPLLLVAATGDWGKHVPRLEGPAIQKAYQALGVPEKFRAVQFDAPHNYNQDSREAVYAWMVRWLQNGPAQDRIPEPPVPAVKREDLTVWTEDHKLPGDAVDAEGLKKLLRDRVAAQLEALRPKDSPSLKKYRDLMEPAWRITLTSKIPVPKGAEGGRGSATLVVAMNGQDAQPIVNALNAKGDRALSLALASGFEPEPADGGDATQRKTFPATFYRTPLARQIQAILDSLATIASDSHAATIRLVGIGDAGLPVLLARSEIGAPLRISQTIVDVSSIDAAVENAHHPALHRLGGWTGAAMLAPPGFLALHGKSFDAGSLRAAYKAAGREGALTISDAAWNTERIVEELAR